MKNKAFFFDIDGTLVYENKGKLFVSEKNYSSNKKISENEAIKLS